MPDEITNEPTTPDEPTEESTDTTADVQGEPDPEGADQLGDAGKKALDAMKAERRELKRQLREAKEALEAAQRPTQKEGEPTAEDIRREAEKSAAEKANARIVRSEIRAAAAGKLADPKDALTFLDASKFEVDENGDVDSEEIAEAIEELLKNKPYLAAKASRFQGTGDGGAARKASEPSQLTRDDLKKMTPAQIMKAQADGRLKNLLSGK